jgi:CheY-like chemotaxis protein
VPGIPNEASIGEISSDRVEVVGLLAGGVSHEVNNPLAVISANIELLERDIEQLRAEADESASSSIERFSVDTAELLKDMREACERVRMIARDLRVFSRSGDRGRAPIDVERVLDSTVRLVRNELGPQARFVSAYSGVPRVTASEPRLGQAFLAMLLGAVDATPTGRADPNEVRVSTSVDRKSHVVIEIRSAVEGEPTSVLGLAIARSLLEAFGGELEIEQAGASMVLRAVLPPSGVAITQPEAPRVQPTAAREKRRGRILIVDDERIVSVALSRLIGRGHDVVTDANAKDALRRIEEGASFDIVLCDIAMPGMSGIELYEAVKAIAPDQAERFVFMTGGAFTERSAAFLESVPNPRLEKPIQPSSLADLIDERMRSLR